MAITYASDLAGMTLPYKKLQRDERDAAERSANMRVGIEALAELLRVRKESLEKRMLGKTVTDETSEYFGVPTHEYKDIGEGYGPTEKLFRELGLALYPTEESFRKVRDEGGVSIAGTPDVIEQQTFEKSGRYRDIWRPGRGLDLAGKGARYAMDWVGKKIGGWLGT